MLTPLPSKELVLAACAGNPALPHPILLAARHLTGLHQRRILAPSAEIPDIDRERIELAHGIDCWVSINRPEVRGGARLHTESVGAVIDRVAAFFVDAHAALQRDAQEAERHRLWRRLAQLADAYADLAYEVSTGRCTTPDTAQLAPSSATADPESRRES